MVVVILGLVAVAADDGVGGNDNGVGNGNPPPP